MDAMGWSDHPICTEMQVRNQKGARYGVTVADISTLQGTDDRLEARYRTHYVPLYNHSAWKMQGQGGELDPVPD